MGTELQYGGNPSATTGSILSLWYDRKKKYHASFNIRPVPEHLQRNNSDGCLGKNCTAYEMMWLPASTFGTSVPYRNNTTQHYSIFAK